MHQLELVFTSEFNMNYTVDVTWAYILNSEVTSYTMDFHLKAVDGNYEYSYADSNYPTLTHYIYLLSAAASSYPICFIDPELDGTYTTVTNGMSEYATYAGQIYLDRVLLFGLNPDDFIYDETKGYITAKDEATEEINCAKLFYYEQG